MTIELTIASLTDHVRHTADGRDVTARERVRDLIELGVLAESLGLDGFALGEHHTSDFAVTSPAVILGAIAARTSTIRLGTAVTVLSAHDPVSVFEDFATLDQVSGGRAEVTVGRGAFIEPFALFGVPVDAYDEVFDEKLALLLRLRSEDRVTWSGKFRPSLHDAEIVPRPLQSLLPVWIGVGGSPSSATRAGRLGLPMIIGTLGMPIGQLKGLADAYREAGSRAGHEDDLRLGVGVHFFAGASEAEARQTHPFYRDFLGPKRPGGSGMHVSPAQFDAGFAPQSTRYIGSSDQVTEKLIALHGAVQFDVFQALPEWGGLPRTLVEESLTRLVDEVGPAVRAVAA